MSLVKHFLIHKGDAFLATVAITKDAVPVVLTSEVVTFHARKLGLDPLLPDSIPAQTLPISDGPTGKVTLQLSLAQTLALVDDAAYAYTIVLTDLAGIPWTVTEGRLYAAPAIDGV